MEKKVKLYKKKKVFVDLYSGKDLQEFVQNALAGITHSRDFVKAIEEYLQSKETRVLSISGLRGTGKTIGILQVIQKLNDYQNTAFLNIDALADLDCADLHNFLEEKCQGKKFLFIDEITRVHGFINNSGFLADRLCKMGVKVVLSGTDSLSLLESAGSGLYHRIINKNVTHISFMEAKRTANQNFQEYMEMGGLYKADAICDLNGLRRYIDTAVVDNIMNTLHKNKKVTGMLGLQKFSDDVEKLRTIVFRIIYAIIYSSTKSMIGVSVSFIVNLFDHRSSSLYDNPTLNSLICSQMGVDENVSVSVQDVEKVLTTMVHLGMLVKIPNIYDYNKFQYYLTNPSIINQLLYAMVTILDSTGLQKRNYANIKILQGSIFESIVITHTKLIADKLGYETFYYHDTENREIDLIVRNQVDDGFDEYFVYYEVKLTDNIDIAVSKSNWINDPEIRRAITEFGEIRESGIIYRGNNETFKKFSSDFAHPANETKNKGVKLFSVVEFLENLKCNLIRNLEH